MADLSIESKHTVGKRIAANTGLMVGSKSLAAILGLGSLSIAAKTIAPIELGTIIFLHVYMLFFSEVATFQSWQSIIRFGTDDVKDNNPKSLASLLNFGVKLDAIADIYELGGLRYPDTLEIRRGLLRSFIVQTARRFHRNFSSF